ncbi:MAG TPA: hypothetical protein VHW00_14060 [Thermoanaerobaculia bacterium]|nr:hypothetical protein [Thermoanaerobaculia bacterium]
MKPLVIFALLFYAAAADAAYLRGSVYLMPIESNTFRSVGTARYFNDLSQEDSRGILSGTHRVIGPQMFQTAVSGAGLYENILEGPAQPGACYDTDLHVNADGPFLNGDVSETFYGAQRCAPGAGPLGPGGGGDLETCDHCDGGSIVNEPLVLDLNGDGIWTTHKDDLPVWFDLDGNGIPDKTNWTAPDHEDGFLYVDWNGNKSIDGGTELFGDATILPDGTRAAHGYQALAAYDDPQHGGSNDHAISHDDSIWSRLRLWIDRNHDGLCTNDETYTLPELGVVSISLEYSTMGREQHYGRDQHANLHLLQGRFSKRERGEIRDLAMHEIWFVSDLN